MATIISKSMKLIVFLVFLGYIMMWIALPTKFYRITWTPILKAKFNTSIFEAQGINIVLFTFPVMVMAICGCIYLHFQSKQRENSTNKRRILSMWRKPVLVMSPLGIVTMVEVAFSAMFIALLIWSMANYLYVSFGDLHMHKEGEKVWQAKFRSVSLRLGYIGNISWAFLFFPLTRTSSILGIFGLTSESSIKYHIWLGHISMVLFAGHTIGFIIYWAITDQMALLLEWSATWVSNVAGDIAVVFALAMWLTSTYKIRRQKFELFFYTHQLYILYIIFYALHVGAAYFFLILPGIFLFIIDRYLRFLQSIKNAQLVSARILPCGVIELNFSKDTGLCYNPGSVMFLNVPSVSKLQWHPFTVVSDCEMEPNVVSVIIKSGGSWTRKLYDRISLSLDHVQVSVEGPYGPSSSDFLRHDQLVMISGGSGITPFISIIRHILFQSTKPNPKITQILLISAFKNSSDLPILDLLIPLNSQITQLPQIQIEAYITREQQQQQQQTLAEIQTKLFKPNPNDFPIAPLLGHKTWLWLAAIIASSFAMFLLLLAVVTRYYIYPVDKNTNVIYHFSYFVLWDLFLGFACAVTVCSLGFFWHKKLQGNGEKIGNFELQSPNESPGFVAEVESFPRQSIVEAVNVHFGGRPDLKKILMECKGKDVGVLACGPRSMRHEVAKICSSGLANNLHFQSISFNW